MKPLPAPGELAALIQKSRPDWDAALFDGALEAARTARWSWDRLAAEVFRLYRIEDSTVNDLLQVIRDPAKRPDGRTDDQHGWAGRARQLLADRHNDENAATEGTA